MSNPNLAAYYRLGDPTNSYSVADSSGNSYNGSLIAGPSGDPAFAAAGAFLYDPNTSLDLTNGANSPGGGISTNDNSTNPPTIQNPLSGAGAWTFETWFKWTGPQPTPTVGSSAAVPNGILARFSSSVSTITEIQLGFWQVSSATGLQTLYGVVVTNNQGTTEISTFPTNPFDGRWHHLAVPYSSSLALNNFLPYLDGTATVSSAGGGPAASVSSFTVGSAPQGMRGIDPSGGSVYAQGAAATIQDVALYSIALTPAQILNHYNIGTWFQQQEYGASVGGVNAGRFNKLMAVEGLNSSQMLNVPYPFRTLMYSETNAVTTTSGLNYLQTMSETEPGLIFQSPTGQINAYNRQYQYLNPTSASTQGIFGDSNAASVLYHYDGPTFALVQDDLDVWNSIQVQSGRSGSQLQQSTSPQSASVYGARTLQGLTSLQQEHDSDALAIAQNYEQWYSTPVKRVTSIMVDSWGNNGNNIPQMLQRGLYDRLTIQYQGQTPGPQFSQGSLIESIAHNVNIANGPTWATTWAMSPYEILFNPTILSVWTFGTPSTQAVLTL